MSLDERADVQGIQQKSLVFLDRNFFRFYEGSHQMKKRKKVWSFGKQKGGGEQTISEQESSQFNPMLMEASNKVRSF